MNFPFFKRNTSEVQSENEPVPVQQETTSSRKTNETYQSWGTRWAGQTNASKAALNTSLNVVVCQLKKEQEEDENLKEQLRKELQTKIDNKETELATEKTKLADEERRLTDCENEISELINEKNKINEDKSGRHNKIAKTNLVIGGTILACITVYLIIFYSSASYSAFFKEFDMDSKITEALFDAQAWGKSLAEGIPEFLFISLLPFLFMGLGFIIHQLGKREKGFGRYAKTMTLYCITFIFDALLAYEISEKMYNLNKGLMDPQYSIPLAFQSPGFWIIIFCGFIAYVIWGMVFDFTMQCYEELDEQKMKLKAIEEKLALKKADKQKKEDLISQIRLNIDKLIKEINNLKTQMITNSQYDYNVIKHELSNFFNGWVAYMKLVQKTDAEVQEAHDVYQSFMTSFNNTLKSKTDEDE